MLKSQQKFQSEAHYVSKEKINKIAWSGISKKHTHMEQMKI